MVPGQLHYQPRPRHYIVWRRCTVCAIAGMWLLARKCPNQAALFLTLAVVSTHFLALGSLDAPSSATAPL